MISPRKLAAIETVFFGSKFVITEFAIAVACSTALGVFVLLRRQFSWQLALGLYLIFLGINYVPMLLYAISMAKRHSARRIGDELGDQRAAMTKYRRQSLSLLVPLLVPMIALLDERRAKD